jgi:tetrapyrrole methylase family protein/MazG family protein
MQEFDKLLNTVKMLRSPEGCPWDRAQTIENYKKFLLEETYELLDEMNKKKIEAVKEELGDLFLILMIICEMFEEKANFNLKDVLVSVNKKLIIRHPHVFSSKKLKTDKEVLAYWIKSKAKHKQRKTIKERLPLTTPSLLLADIFFKEYSHIKKSRRQSQSVLCKNLTSKLASIDKYENKEGVFGEIIFNLARLASLYHLDLENILRKKIFSQAQNALY